MARLQPRFERLVPGMDALVRVLPIARMDRYVARELVNPFLAGMAAFLVMNIFNLLYIFANLIFSSGVPVSGAIEMLAYNIPAILVICFPVCYLFAVMLTTGRLSRDSEVTALRACGVSFRRITVPLLLVSLFLSVAGFEINDRVVPWANHQFVVLVRTLALRQSTPVFADDKYFKGKGDLYFYVREIDQRNDQMQDVAVYDETPGHKEVLTAKRGVWTGKIWQLYDGMDNVYGSDGFVQSETPFVQRTVDVGQSADGFFTQGQLSPQEQTSSELWRHIQELRASGIDTKGMRVDFYMKYSLPLATFFVALLAAPLGLRFARISPFIGLALTIACVFVYYIVMSICRSMGNAGLLDPINAAWFENYLFGVVGAFLLWRVDRVRT